MKSLLIVFFLTVAICLPISNTCFGQPPIPNNARQAHNVPADTQIKTQVTITPNTNVIAGLPHPAAPVTLAWLDESHTNLWVTGYNINHGTNELAMSNVASVTNWGKITNGTSTNNSVFAFVTFTNVYINEEHYFTVTSFGQLGEESDASSFFDMIVPGALVETIGTNGLPNLLFMNIGTNVWLQSSSTLNGPWTNRIQVAMNQTALQTFTETNPAAIFYYRLKNTTN